MSLAEIGKSDALGRPVVLIVDDDLSSLEKLQRSLRESFTVHTSTSAIEALHVLQKLADVNILIVDNDLPRMKGTELFRFLREMTRDSEAIVKILITDASREHTTIDSASIGRIDYCFTKPVDPREVRRKASHLLAQRSKERRTSFRVALNEAADVKVDTGLPGNTEVLNLSENGLFLKTFAPFEKGAVLPLTIVLPDGRQHAVSGRIVRHDVEHGGFGVEFLSLDDRGRTSLMEFLSDYVALRGLDDLKERYPFLRTEEMVLFTDSYKIETLMREALKMRVETVVIRPQSRVPEILELGDVRPPSTCVLAGEGLNIKFKTSDLVFVSFSIGYATYNFETMISRISQDGRRMQCFYPRVMFYSEKRNSKRFSPNGNLGLEIVLPPPFGWTIRGKITDISPEGVSFTTPADGPPLLVGTPLDTIRILEGGRPVWEEKGEVRNVTMADSGNGGKIRYGIQFGIGRMNIQSTRAPEPGLSAEAATGQKNGAPSLGRTVELAELAHRPPEVIRLENERGEEIVGLLNVSFPIGDQPVPIVLIPPAFGKTKETLFGLALTIIQNFFLMDRPVAVIRYDGIRRKGESHKDPEASESPYEMVNANFSQGASDIKAVLDWLQLNPKLRPSSVVLLSFSLSALEARIVLRDEAFHNRIHYWISCMGTPEFRDLMIRVNCGLDFLEQYQLGIPLGIMPVLGNLVNVDPYVADGVANGVATLDQAREDMRRIPVPVTWIYGQHDNWVKADFIRDVMSIRAEAPREVISVPIGHNARTSTEALRVFGLIASLIHRFFFREMIQPALPGKSDLEVMRRAEKDRLPLRKLANRKSYWQRYLVGEKDLLGFDVMTLSDDYRQLMEDQLQALELGPEDRFLDLGGGTGNFIERLLESGRSLPSHMLVADLVPEAMKQAAQKLLSKFEVLKDPRRFGFVCLDIELSRFLPIRRFLSGEVGSFGDLADRIENLDLESARKIQKINTPRLHRILRGEPVTPALDAWLKSRFDLPEYRIIIDFNQASRYVRKLIPEKPSFRRLVMPSGLEGNVYLPVRTASYNKILMSLVLSYIFNPLETLREARRVAGPGGRLVLSSMRPDTDASGPFTRLMAKIETTPAENLPPKWPKARLLESLRSFLNDAQALVDLEEAGTFDFFDPEKLEGLLDEADWDILRTVPTFGDPPQGYIMVAEARHAHG